jgi:serine/threonine protein phosphatase PrpC
MLEVFGVSDPGCVRRNNEDYFFIDAELGLYLLADGMGGAQAGETASQLAVETVVNCVRSTSERSVNTLTEAFREANRKVREAAASDSHLTGMGTTLIGVLECGEMLAIASVGDSRVYMLENGTFKPITEDQTWANEVGRKLGLDEQRLKSHPMRHVLTMAIGVESPLRIHSYEVRPGPDVQFLLCSDGLHGVVAPDSMAKRLRDPLSLQDKCQCLVEMAREAGGPDNITAILIHSDSHFPAAH